MAIVYFLCGLPTAGKTTLAKQIEVEVGAVRFTLDERMIAKYDYTIFDEEYGRFATAEKELIWQEAQEVLKNGRDAILDWSLWSRAARAEWSQKVLAAGYNYRLIYLDVSLAVLEQRLAARNAAVPLAAHVIPFSEVQRFSKIFEPPLNDEGLNLEVVSVK